MQKDVFPPVKYKSRMAWMICGLQYGFECITSIFEPGPWLKVRWSQLNKSYSLLVPLGTCNYSSNVATQQCEQCPLVPWAQTRPKQLCCSGLLPHCGNGESERAALNKCQLCSPRQRKSLPQE